MVGIRALLESSEWVLPHFEESFRESHVGEKETNVDSALILTPQGDPGCPGAHSIGQPSLKLRGDLGLMLGDTMPGQVGPSVSGSAVLRENNKRLNRRHQLVGLFKKKAKSGGGALQTNLPEGFFPV